MQDENVDIKFFDLGDGMNFLTDVAKEIKHVEMKSDPIVIRINQFDEQTAREFASAISKAQGTGQPIVPVIIDSYGGEVYSLISMMSSIMNSKIPIATIVQGKAMSCGAILFAMGADGLRFVDPDSIIMIHEISGASWGKIEEIKANSKHLEFLNKTIYVKMAKHLGKQESFFLDKIHEFGHADWFLTATEAQEIGIANHIGLPVMKCKINVEWAFGLSK